MADPLTAGISDCAIGAGRVRPRDTGQDRIGQVHAGQVRAGQGHVGQGHVGQVHYQEIHFLEMRALEIPVFYFAFFRSASTHLVFALITQPLMVVDTGITPAPATRSEVTAHTATKDP